MEFSSFSDPAQFCRVGCTVPAKIHMFWVLMKTFWKNQKMFSSSLTCKQGSQDSVVVQSQAMGWMAQGSNPDGQEIVFCKPSRLALGPACPPILLLSRYQGSFLHGVKQLWSKADCSLHLVLKLGTKRVTCLSCGQGLHLFIITNKIWNNWNGEVETNINETISHRTQIYSHSL